MGGGWDGKIRKKENKRRGRAFCEVPTRVLYACRNLALRVVAAKAEGNIQRQDKNQNSDVLL